jgi:hypothetical protein
MRTAASLLALAALVAVAVPAPGQAHRGGKAEPRIAAGVSAGPGLVRVITVGLTDVDQKGVPISGATVIAVADMTRPHIMQGPRWPLAEGPEGIYRARVRFPMAAKWTLAIGVTGKDVVPASSRSSIAIDRAPAAASRPAPAPAGVPDLTTLPTRLEDEIRSRDLLTMAVLWIHGIAAMGWIVGVLAMLIALSSRPGVLAEAVRERIARAYRRWGAWAHWGLVPVIVGTGVYNMLYVTPFPLRFSPEGFERLAEVPYGPVYEAILIVKLGLFAALLVTGTQVLLRTLGPPTAEPRAGARGPVRVLALALGPSGIFYLATIPLILGAAMALRYVHILSHVAEVILGG